MDTTFLIDLIRNKKEAVEILNILENSEDIKSTSISIYEIYKGLIKGAKKVQEIENILDDLVILDFDKKAAKQAGKIKRTLIKSGREIESEDCMIAAIAIQNGETLLTRNTSHFERIDDLKVRNY